MPWRLNVLAIITVLFTLLLLLNSHKVQIQILFVQTHLPLGGIMATCIGIGVGLTFLFLSLGRSYKKILHRLKRAAKPAP